MIRHLFELDDRQAAAATAPEGPAEIAGASGTGKTEALLARGVHLLTCGVRPEEIVIFTPHDRHAEVLRSRLSSLQGRFDERRFLMDAEERRLDELRHLVEQAARIRVATPAQYACWLVRQMTGFPFSLWSAQDEIDVLTALTKTAGFPAEMGGREIQRFHDWHVVNLFLAPAEPRQRVPHRHWIDLEQRYLEEMRTCAAWGQPHLLRGATEAAKNEDRTDLHRHFLVDHLEDMSRTQVLLIEALARRTRSITVALDPAQPGDGAGHWSPSHVFETFFPRAVIHELESVYRAGRSLTAAAARLAGYRRHGPYAYGGREVHRGPNATARLGEVACVALSGRARLEVECIRRLLSDRGGPWYMQGDIAIICDEWPQGERIASMLTSRSVTHQVETGLSRLRRKTGARRASEPDNGARGILDILTCAANPHDPQAFRAAVAAGPRPAAARLSGKSVGEIRAMARAHGANLLEAARTYTQDMDPRRTEFRALRPVVEGCHILGTLLREGTDDVVTTMIERADGMMALARGGAPPTRRYERQRDRLIGLSAQYRTSGEETPNRVLRRFLDDLSPVLHPNCNLLEGPIDRAPRVTLTTAEAAMGREWSAVIVVTGEDSTGGGDGLRNLWRATSRARDRLLIIVPSLPTAGRNHLHAGLLRLIFGDACTVAGMGVKDVENLSTPGNAGTGQDPVGGHRQHEAE